MTKYERGGVKKISTLAPINDAGCSAHGCVHDALEGDMNKNEMRSRVH
jgi:hypothetical protein